MVNANKDCINILLKLVFDIKRILEQYRKMGMKLKVRKLYFRVLGEKKVGEASLTAEPFLKDVPNEYLIYNVYNKLYQIDKEAMDTANKCLHQAIGLEVKGTWAIYQFVHIIAKKLIEMNLVCDEKLAEDWIQRYLNILSGKSIKRVLVGIITGIEPPDSIQINDFMELRRVLPEDILDKEMSYEDFYMKQNLLLSILSRGTATILFKPKDKKLKVIPPLEFNAILYLLKLYKLGSIKELCIIDLTITPFWVKKFS